jgi:hypothetical protein
MKYLLLALLLYGCMHKSVSREKKADFELEFLFEKDGCKMYRFYDGGRYVYWANCNGKVNSDYTTTMSNGKTATTINHYTESITTTK